MKRDMDLVRAILLQLEAGQPVPPVEGYTNDEVFYHCELMQDADLIEANLVVNTLNPPEVHRIVGHARIKWAGQDFLDAARNESVWSSTKQLVTKKGLSVTFDLLKALLVMEIKSRLPHI